MAKFRFQRGVHLVLNGRECIIEQRLADSRWQIRDVANETYISAFNSELVDAFFAGQLQLIGEERAAKYVQRKIAKDLSLDFTELPEEIRKEVKRRLAYVRSIPMEHRNTAKETILVPIIEKVSKQIGDPFPPSCITLYRWARDFTASGEDIRSLIPSVKNKGNRSDKVPQTRVSEIIDEVIAGYYLTTKRPSVQAVYEAIVLRIDDENRSKAEDDEHLRLPAQTTVYNRIGKKDPYDVAKARYGSAYADQKFNVVGAGPRTNRPLERVELDHTKIDLFVVDDESRLPIGRPWFTSIIDRYTRAITGFYLSFNPPSYLSIMHCLRHSVMPKTYLREKYPTIQNTWDMYGIPELLVTDNGKEMLSTSLEDACLQIGTKVQFAPIKLPWYKGTKERFFKSLNTQFLHRQPGTSFSNIFDRKDYNPTKNAVIGFKTLMELIHVWIVDVYLQKEHRGLNDVPARVWAVGTSDFEPELPKRKEDLNVLLGEVIKRKVTKVGIEWEGLIYKGDGLSLLRRRLGEQFATVKFDPSNIGVMHVEDPLTSSYIKVLAVDASYAIGLSKWQHMVIKEYARRNVKGVIDIAALVRAKANIQRIVQEEYHRTKKTGSRQKMARWLNAGSVEQRPQQSGGNQILPLTNVNPSQDSMPSITELESATWSGTSDFTQPDEQHNTISENTPEIKDASQNDGAIVSAEELAARKNQKQKNAKMLKENAAKKQALKDRSSEFNAAPLSSSTASAKDDCIDLDATGWGGSYFDVDQGD